MEKVALRPFHLSNRCGLRTVASSQSRNMQLSCVKTVSKPLLFWALELCLSEKQKPQMIVFNRSRRNQEERLERACVLVRQAL
jgi:hypothetical protein